MVSSIMALSLKAKREDRLELSIPIGFRLVLLFFFFLLCMLLLSSDLSGHSKRPSTLPLILCIVTGLGAFYEEKWIFDRKRKICESRFGLVPFHRTRSIPLDEIDRVELLSFTKGRADEPSRNTDQGPSLRIFSLDGLLKMPQWHRIVKLAIVDKHERAHVLDSARGSRIEEFRRKGRRIADFCRIPFQEK